MSRKIQEEIYRKSGKRSLSHTKTLIKHVFRLFYLRELLMIFERGYNDLCDSVLERIYSKEHKLYKTLVRVIKLSLNNHLKWKHGT